jgi:hypothetical protein
MTHFRKTIAAAALLVTFAIASSAAPASPLLSGYGGPGQGSQAILGSALVNGGQGGGGSSGSGGPSIAASAAGTSGVQPVAGAPARHAKAAKPTSHRHASSAGAKAGGGRSGDASPAYIVGRRATDGSVVALSTGDVLGALAVLAALVGVAVATRLLARRGAGAGPSKGGTRNSRANG